MSWGYVCSTVKEQNFGYDSKIMTAAEVIWIIGLLIIAYFSFQKNNFTIWTLDLQVPSTWAPEVESSSFMPSCTHLYGSCSKHSWLASLSASPVNTGSFAFNRMLCLKFSPPPPQFYHSGLLLWVRYSFFLANPGQPRRMWAGVC